jgi:hypothetical protein
VEQTEEVGSSGHASDLYLWGVRFESQPGHQLSWGCSWFIQPLRANSGTVPSIKPLPLPPTSFLIHAIESELLTASSGKLQTKSMHIASEVLTAVIMKCSVFWYIATCSPMKVNRSFEGTYRLHLHCRRISQARNQREAGGKLNFLIVPYLAYSSTLKMEATCSSETSTDFHRTTLRYIPEDRTLNNLCSRVILAKRLAAQVLKKSFQDD